MLGNWFYFLFRDSHILIDRFGYSREFNWPFRWAPSSCCFREGRVSCHASIRCSLFSLIDHGGHNNWLTTAGYTPFSVSSSGYLLCFNACKSHLSNVFTVHGIFWWCSASEWFKSPFSGSASSIGTFLDFHDRCSRCDFANITFGSFCIKVLFVSISSFVAHGTLFNRLSFPWTVCMSLSRRCRGRFHRFAGLSNTRGEYQFRLEEFLFTPSLHLLSF